MSSSGGRLRPELVYLGNRPKVLFYHCPNSTQLPPNDRPIATQLPPNCHPIATQLPPNCHPITTQSPPNYRPIATGVPWEPTEGALLSLSPIFLSLAHFSPNVTRPFPLYMHLPPCPPLPRSRALPAPMRSWQDRRRDGCRCDGSRRRARLPSGLTPLRA